MITVSLKTENKYLKKCAIQKLFEENEFMFYVKFEIFLKVLNKIVSAIITDINENFKDNSEKKLQI